MLYILQVLYVLHTGVLYRGPSGECLRMHAAMDCCVGMLVSSCPYRIDMLEWRSLSSSGFFFVLEGNATPYPRTLLAECKYCLHIHFIGCAQTSDLRFRGRDCASIATHPCRFLNLTKQCLSIFFHTVHKKRAIVESLGRNGYYESGTGLHLFLSDGATLQHSDGTRTVTACAL